MKKIVLGCAAVLLSLGLLAGCNKDDDVDDKINNTGPEENEPTDDGNEGTTDTGPGPETGGSGSGGDTGGDGGSGDGGDGDTGTTEPGPEEEVEPHSHDVVVTSPDNKGVYVLGYSGEEGDTYLTYEESELGSSMAYSSAVSVRTLAVEGGYNLQLSEEEYLGTEEGALAVGDTATTVAVDSSTGAITCNSLTLTVDDEGAFVWAETATTPVVLMDVAYDHDAAVIEDSTNLVLALVVDGEYKYITGNTVGYKDRGELTTDISEAAVITIEADASADNAYKMSFVLDAETYYISIGTYGSGEGASNDNVTGVMYTTEEAVIYYDETTGHWADETGAYWLCYRTDFDCLHTNTVNAATATIVATLYYDSTVPALRGVVIEDTSESVPYAGTLQLEYQLYPTCLEDASSLVWTGDSYVSVNNGLVTGNQITENAVVTVSGEGIFGDSITLTVESIPVTVEITAQYIIDNFVRDNEDGHGDKYNLGSSSSETDNTATQTDVIGGVTMDFGVFDVEWTNGNTNTKLWTGNQIRVYTNGGGYKVTPHTGWTLTGLSATDSQGKLSAYTLSTINQSSASTTLTSGTDYTITNSNKQLDMASSFSTTDTLFVCNNPGSSSSNTSYFTSIIVTCEAAA